MRTTVSLPDQLAADVREVSEGTSFSEFARTAIFRRVQELRARRVALAMEAGYRSEADESSIDAEWAEIEVEDW